MIFLILDPDGIENERTCGNAIKYKVNSGSFS
jgi:hypothetical protein